MGRVDPLRSQPSERGAAGGGEVGALLVANFGEAFVAVGAVGVREWCAAGSAGVHQPRRRGLYS
jgi:hypothetical protein